MSAYLLGRTWTTLFGSAAMVLIACVPQRSIEPPQITPPGGHDRVMPTPFAQVGRIFREGTGERPWLLLNGQTVYSMICWDDFLETNALRDFDEHFVLAEDRIIYPNATTSIAFSIGGRAGAVVLGPQVGAAGSLAPSASYSLTNARLVTLTEAGRAVIREHIGENCRALIRENLAAGRQVVVVAEGLRADSGVQTAGVKVDLQARGGPAVIGLVSDATSEVVTSRLLISVRMTDL